MNEHSGAGLIIAPWGRAAITSESGRPIVSGYAKHTYAPMKFHLRFAILLLVATSAFAADPAPAHWYQIVVSEGASPKTFTGTCAFDGEQLAQRLSGNDPIVMENLRDIYIQATDKGMTWHGDDTVTRVVIPPRNILYFSEITGDPVNWKK
jgi:hypothetical protein